MTPERKKDLECFLAIVVFLIVVAVLLWGDWKRSEHVPTQVLPAPADEQQILPGPSDDEELPAPDRGKLVIPPGVPVTVTDVDPLTGRRRVLHIDANGRIEE